MRIHLMFVLAVFGFLKVARSRGGCVDVSNWVDSAGENCAAYEVNTEWCEDSPQDFAADGQDATSACCVCKDINLLCPNRIIPTAAYCQSSTSTSECIRLIDGNTATPLSFADDNAPYDFQFYLSQKTTIHKVCYMTDWHTKAPKNVQILTAVSYIDSYVPFYTFTGKVPPVGEYMAEEWQCYEAPSNRDGVQRVRFSIDSTYDTTHLDMFEVAFCGDPDSLIRSDKDKLVLVSGFMVGAAGAMLSVGAAVVVVILKKRRKYKKVVTQLDIAQK